MLSATAFVAGYTVRSSQNIVTELEAAIPVDSTVVNREFGNELVAQATVAEGVEVRVSGIETSPFDRAIVTENRIQVGDSVKSGTVLGAISNRPLWAFTLDVPLYRDMRIGDRGPDVSAMQEALGIAPSGLFDLSLQRSVENLYVEAGFEPPRDELGRIYVRRAEVFALQELASVTSISAVGSVLNEDTPLAILSVGPPSVTVRVTVIEVEAIELGQEFSVVGSRGGVGIATVDHIGLFVPADGTSNSAFPGHDVRLSLEVSSPAEDLEPGKPVVISSIESASEMLLALPEVAVRGDGDQLYVLRVRATGELQRVEVTVMERENGWVALQADGQLREGHVVRLQP